MRIRRSATEWWSRVLCLFTAAVLVACADPESSTGGPDSTVVWDAAEALTDLAAADVPGTADVPDVSEVSAAVDVTPDAPPDLADAPSRTDGSDVSDGTGGTDAAQDAASTPDGSVLDTASSDVTALDGSATDGGSGPDASFAVLSLNLHCLKTDGTSYADNAARFAAIATAAAAEGVHVLLLQEACARPGEDAIDMLHGALESATGVQWSQAWALAHAAWEGTADEAEEGVGLLVRGALSNPTPIVHLVQGGLQRVALSADLPPELGGLRVTTVHFDHQAPAVRQMQARETANAALVDSAPGLGALVGGDLNAMVGSATHEAMLHWGFLDQSAALDSGRIDHIFVHRGTSWRASETRLMFTGDAEPVVSDHPGVLVRLAPATPANVSVTRIDATVDVGFGHFIALRGDTAPFNWQAGWPARAVTSDLWRLVVTELPPGTFLFKALRDDSDWQSGDDTTGTVGEDNSVAPTF